MGAIFSISNRQQICEPIGWGRLVKRAADEIVSLKICIYFTFQGVGEGNSFKSSHLSQMHFLVLSTTVAPEFMFHLTSHVVSEFARRWVISSHPSKSAASCVAVTSFTARFGVKIRYSAKLL